MDRIETRLLVVDDDADIRTLLAEQLRAAGFDTLTAPDGAAMRRILNQDESIDLIVLDLNLPKEDGLSLCRSIRAESSIPVIMLTARGAPIDRIVGLEMGADDYVSKPFEPRELIARIKNVLRRVQALPANLEPLAFRIAGFGGWKLDIEKRELVDPSGRLVILSGVEFRLLINFIEHANKVLTRDQIVALSGGKPGENLDRSVDLRVSRLRRKLGKDSDYIKTVRNEGYVLACQVELE